MQEKINENQNNTSTGTKTSHHSHHSTRHSPRRKRKSIWYRLTRPFRKRRGRVSGVILHQQIVEKRIMVLFTLGTIVLLILLVLFISWLMYFVANNPN